MDARRQRQRGRPPRTAPVRDPLDDPPGVFEAVTRQMVKVVAEELREVRHRVDNLLWMVAGTILLDTALRLMGT